MFLGGGGLVSLKSAFCTLPACLSPSKWGKDIKLVWERNVTKGGVCFALCVVCIVLDGLPHGLVWLCFLYFVLAALMPLFRSALAFL